MKGFTPAKRYVEVSVGESVRVLRELQEMSQNDLADINRGLRRYYETGSKSGIQTKHAARLRLQLAALDTSRVIDDMDVPGYRLHPLKGRAKNRWSIWVSGNWRLTFEFRDGNAYVLDYEDYH